jgi:zinc transporter ZupT
MEVVIILLIALAGGLLPLFIRWSDRHLHTALALSTGIFLGAVFLHLLPSIAVMTTETVSHGDHAHVHGDITLWGFVLVGVLGVYLIESFLLPGHSHAPGSPEKDPHTHASSGEQPHTPAAPTIESHDHAQPSHAHDNHCHEPAHDLTRHRTVGIAAMVGLSIHALTAGISLAAAGQAAIGNVLLFAICAHKGFEAFSLATVFQLAQLSRKTIAWLMVLFALVTPIGVAIGSVALNTLGEQGMGIAAALAAGTFLYVCLCELLPEVFHRREDRGIKTLLLLAGIGSLYWFESFDGASL